MTGKLISHVAVLCGLCWTGFAQSSANKVGVVNMQEAVIKTKEGQQATQQLDSKYQPKQKEFEQRQMEIVQLQDQFNKGGGVLSEEKRNQLAKDIEVKKKKLERDTTDARDELAADQQRLLQGLGQRMLAVIEKYSKDRGYLLVVDVSNPDTSMVYASPAIDLTQDIIAQYDQANSAAAGRKPPEAVK